MGFYGLQELEWTQIKTNLKITKCTANSFPISLLIFIPIGAVEISANYVGCCLFTIFERLDFQIKLNLLGSEIYNYCKPRFEAKCGL